MSTGSELYDLLAKTNATLNPNNTITLRFNDGSSYTTGVIKDGPELSPADKAMEEAKEASTISQAAMEEASKAAVAAGNAEQSASEAAASATNAENFASEAQQSASTASTAATNAETSAGNAATSASNAATNAQAAATSASAAEGSAQTAATEASEAKTQATAATSYANGALNSLSTTQDIIGVLSWVEESIKYVWDYPPTVEDKEYDPSKQYYTVIGKRVINPVETDYDKYYVLESENEPASKTGNIVTFDSDLDNFPLKSLTATINPKQDLHGYDKPWVGGAGKNKLDESTFTSNDTFAEINGVFSNASTDPRNYFSAVVRGYHSDDTFEDMSITPFSATGRRAFPTFTPQADIVRIAILHSGSQLNLECYFDCQLKSGQTYNASLNIIGFNPQIVGGLSFDKIQIETGTTATAYEPYSNICPISGWTEVDVYNDPIYGGTVVWNQLVPTASKESTNTLADTRTKTLFYVRKSDTPYTTLYYTEIENNFSGVKQTIFKANFTGLIGILHSGSVQDLYVLQGSDNVAVQNGHVYAFNIDFISNDVTTVGGFHTDDLQLIDLTQMFGTTIADYIYSLEQANAGDGVAWFKKLFPKDYYEYNAGEETTVSAINGDPYTKVTAQLGQTVYGGTLDVVSGLLTAYPFYPSYNGETLGGRWICDRAVYVEGTTPPTGSQVALISGMGTTYQLTPKQVTTLLGTNNVWADVGDVTVEYWDGPVGYVTPTSSFDPTEAYYTVKGSPVKIDESKQEDHGKGLYYVHDLTNAKEAMADFIKARLALTDKGLYVVGGDTENEGYKILLASDGMTVYDAQGNAVSKFGENIEFSATRAQYIGGETAYIVFNPEDGTINAGGEGFRFNNNMTLSDMLAEIGKIGGEDGLEQSTEDLLQKTKSISYENGKLIISGGENSNMKLVMESDRIGFYDGDNEVAYISNNQMCIPRSIVLDSLDMGDNKWRWTLNTDDHLTLQWIGG